MDCSRVIGGVLGALLLGMVHPGHAAADALVQLHFGNRDRSYLIHVPAKLNGWVPLVLALHGGGGNANTMRDTSGFDALADQAGFIVVYPNGSGRSHPLLKLFGKPGFLTWNAGNCCGYALEHHLDDTGFLRAVVRQVMSQHAIDPRRVYATGMSNGGMMAYTLACKESDLFAAVGIVSGIVTDPGCKPSYPVSVIHFHGSADQNVPINGGIGRKALVKQQRPPVKDSIAFWVKADACDSKPQESHQPGLDIERYAGCRAGTVVTYYIIRNGGHAWPGGKRLSRLLDKPSQAINATNVMWQFFVSHPKQQLSHD